MASKCEIVGLGSVWEDETLTGDDMVAVFKWRLRVERTDGNRVEAHFDAPQISRTLEGHRYQVNLIEYDADGRGVDCDKGANGKRYYVVCSVVSSETADWIVELNAKVLKLIYTSDEDDLTEIKWIVTIKACPGVKGCPDIKIESNTVYKTPGYYWGRALKDEGLSGPEKQNPIVIIGGCDEDLDRYSDIDKLPEEGYIIIPPSNKPYTYDTAAEID